MTAHCVQEAGSLLICKNQDVEAAGLEHVVVLQVDDVAHVGLRELKVASKLTSFRDQSLNMLRNKALLWLLVSVRGN